MKRINSLVELWKQQNPDKLRFVKLIKEVGVSYMLKWIMCRKDRMGEFSLDLYYNDIYDEYVAKLTVVYPDEEGLPHTRTEHYREDSLEEALADFLVANIDKIQI